MFEYKSETNLDTHIVCGVTRCLINSITTTNWPHKNDQLHHGLLMFYIIQLTNLYTLIIQHTYNKDLVFYTYRSTVELKIICTPQIHNF